MALPISLKRMFPSGALSLEKVDAPLRDRVIAWWEGCSVAELLDSTPGDGGSDSEKMTEVEENGGQSSGIVQSQIREESGDENNGRFWSKNRIAVSEQLWGEGEITPGGTERTLEMIGAFGLGTEVNVLNLGMGLGGTACCIAKQYQAWVTGYDQDPDLAAVAMARSEKAGLSKKAEMRHAKFSDIELRPNIFDCVFSREVLFTAVDRDEILLSVQNGLKSHCPFLFTDYFVTKGREDDPAVAKWIESEPATVYPWTVDSAQDALCQTNSELRVAEDISATVRSDIITGWAAFVGNCEKTGIPLHLLGAVSDLAEHWSHRVAALESGAVTVNRIVALKI